MTQEYKELLLKDLCMRLPYMTKVHTDEASPDIKDDDYILLSINANKRMVVLGLDFEDTYVTHNEYLDNIKPYLRPMSSMTDKEKEDWRWKSTDGGWGFDERDFADIVDWLNAHYLDWRRIYDEKEDKWKSMIEIGLALPAPEGMYEFK